MMQIDNLIKLDGISEASSSETTGAAVRPLTRPKTGFTVQNCTEVHCLSDCTPLGFGPLELPQMSPQLVTTMYGA